MSSMQHVKENIESANNSAMNSLSEDELQTINELRKAYDKFDIVPCTSCGYCEPCPNGVSIPWVFRFLNELGYWGDERKARISFFYDRMAKTQEAIEKGLAQGEEVDGMRGGAAILCIQCGECLEKCPQQINIPDIMEKANAIFEEGKKVSDFF
jgi:predicted aldo/keto reductase-like oxidoreductase